MLQGRADGVVGTFFHLRIPELTVLARSGIPLVRLESQHKSEGPLPIDSVYIDNSEAAAAMTRHLIARGHRRIAMIVAEFGPSHRRALGYSSVMREAGLEPEFVTDSAYSEESGARAMQSLLAGKRNRVTAVFGAATYWRWARCRPREAPTFDPDDTLSPGLTIFRGKLLASPPCVNRNSTRALAAPRWSRLQPGGLEFGKKSRTEI